MRDHASRAARTFVVTASTGGFRKTLRDLAAVLDACPPTERAAIERAIDDLARGAGILVAVWRDLSPEFRTSVIDLAIAIGNDYVETGRSIEWYLQVLADRGVRELAVPLRSCLSMIRTIRTSDHSALFDAVVMPALAVAAWRRTLQIAASIRPFAQLMKSVRDAGPQPRISPIVDALGREAQNLARRYFDALRSEVAGENPRGLATPGALRAGAGVGDLDALSTEERQGKAGRPVKPNEAIVRRLISVGWSQVAVARALGTSTKDVRNKLQRERGRRSHAVDPQLRRT
jgi:hypothetical protein